MEKPKKANYKFRFGMCISFREEDYKNDMIKYKEYLSSIKNTHGGSRPNSGRPKLGKKKYLITSVPEHIEEIRRYIKELHKPTN